MTGTNESHHELDEVLGSHEDRLVNELHKMSSSFESFTQDRRLIANFFDFINFRLVATCKKIETEYFSQRAERIAEDGEKSIKNEVKHLINGATEIVRHKTREKNDEEDEESDHDSELLKIVEDYGENDILKKSSEHLINNVSILEKDVTQSIDIIKSDMPNSFNFPLELIISSESDDNDREKLHDLTTKKRAKRFKGKMTKKQKIDDDIVPNTTNAEGSPNTTNMEINEELGYKGWLEGGRG
ncbi:uncharacterized protein LOC116347450 [Contarinia nasturtii]|uniref:uncharacterized protein LOC116347450 n=1 Tax=Contarinia nasturtii TaxID=265458 RepID=UPI0012D3C6F0|nr:uncharacterized protein LOC116347450 [Contarinia nasturtii]